MWQYDKLNEVQKALLKQHTIYLGGSIDAAMGFYVHEALVRLEALGSPDVKVKITSDGGNLGITLQIYDMLRLYAGTITGIVTGTCRSGAVIILQACDIRKSARHAEFMIHNVAHHFQVGNDTLQSRKGVAEIQRESLIATKRLYRILVKATGRKKREIRLMCKKERDMTAEEAKKLGLIDKII